MNDREKDLKIAMSMPGIGRISAMTILAEIGNFEEFITPEKLAAMVRINTIRLPIC